MFILFLMREDDSLAKKTKEQKTSFKNLHQSVFYIEAVTQHYSTEIPWKKAEFEMGIGTGFLLADNQFIITNAHLVDGARKIFVKKEKEPTRYPAKLIFVAFDSDLAVIKVEDHNFYKDTIPLQFAKEPLPSHGDRAFVYGFALGKEVASLTQGIVSRIHYVDYVVSNSSHLSIQVDAAINVGNSGGPILNEKNEVIGIAFQYTSEKNSVGDGIPVLVIKHFLQDIKDGSYDGYIDFGFSYFPLQNPDDRSALNLTGDRGVIIARLYDKTPEIEILKEGDILVSVDQYPIYMDGTLSMDETIIPLAKYAEKKHINDLISFDILRRGEKLTASWRVRSFPGVKVYRELPNSQVPEHLILGGLVFQPLSYNLIQGKNLSEYVYYTYTTYLSKNVYRDNPTPIVLTNVIPNPANSHLVQIPFGIVNFVNDIPIKTIADIRIAVAKAFVDKKSYLSISFEEESFPPIVIEVKKLIQQGIK